ncbi:hypothetical protein [Streptomyces sp. NPDC001933]|uniref:hypothetical protein n=1 Tax=Streptomyces sp. NPDC001933 TaxID=3364626 RepID=UPI00367E30D8
MAGPPAQRDVARTALKTLNNAGNDDFRVSGSLALHMHDIPGAALTREITLTSEKTFEGARTRSALAGELRLASYDVVESPTNLLVRSSDLLPIALRIQSLPHGAPPQIVDGIATATVEDVLFRTIDLLHSRSEACDFIDLDALRTHAGQDTFDRFVRAYLSGQAAADPQNRPVTHHASRLFERLALVMRRSDNELQYYGHPDPSRLRDSVLQTAGRTVEEVPEAAWFLHSSLSRLRAVEAGETAALFDAATDAATPVDSSWTQERERRILILQAAIRLRQQGTARRVPSVSSAASTGDPGHQHKHQLPSVHGGPGRAM